MPCKRNASNNLNNASANEHQDKSLIGKVVASESISLTLVASTTFFLLRRAQFENHAFADAIDISAGPSTFINSLMITVRETLQASTVKGRFLCQRLND